ncbi:hypothetical protein K432DRAFT_414050 [Lepidopterella palustris CBS 459.81]|uniref:Uncharacterized protein n=1 Tax=Lepidopterella palustris CBS 459.81 TaxID=1314670 RepID=A0A8E2EI24_9PEZI|nr:hypothetical protein K432DRAFT_414050 [Lepidopterella palustris CBS 459.81]
MRSISLLVALAAFAAASPFPQDLPIDAIIEAGPPPNVTVPVDGASSEQISYDPSAVISETVAFVTADPLPQRKRSLQKRSATCTPLPAGSGPVPTPDTPSAFLAYSAFAAAASQAPAPAGYVQTFQNLQASNNANGYLGYKSLTTYDVSACAKACDGVKGCSAFNIYFERDPALAPGADCLNPNSTTVIKCVYWGGPVTAENAVNKGQWRNNFQVVIAGSNGYVNQTVTNVPGYKGTFLNNAAVNAPLDCNGNDTYMGYKLFNDGAPFDATRCAAACDAQSAYNIAHPPQSGPPKICRFFNTYLMEKNGLSQGQMCSMYTLAWDSSYAVNTGQTRGTDVYSIAYRYDLIPT